MTESLNLDLMPGYNVHRESDRRAMLDVIGARSIDDLFSQIPDAVRLKRPLKLPPPLSEWALQKHLQSLARKNVTTFGSLSLLGAGAYEHYIPAVVAAIASRGEFLTAYTPYQPEMSQGLLQVLHDFQSLMGKLLGLPIVNCSVYDGATALAEAAWMACSIKGLKRVAVADSIWPDWRQVLETYMNGRGVELISIPSDPSTGQVDLKKLDLALASPCAGFLTQTPNLFGVIENVAAVCQICSPRGALSVVSVYPMLPGCLKSPGELGADIVCCEGQSLGVPLNAGGPYVGVMATHPEYQKYLPGRIVGVCKDIKEEPALALVAEEREQHVSRDKATSHICSNQALLALRIVLYLTSVGERGFKQIARLNTEKAHYLCDRLCSIPGVTLAKSGAFFNEFTLRLPCAAELLLTELRRQNILGGVHLARFDPALENHLLIAVTEVKSRSELDTIYRAFAAFMGAPAD